MKRYKISVRISDHDLANTDEIRMATDDCWLFGEYEWSEKPGEMRVSALGDLYDNQDIDTFAERLSQTIRTANNSSCSVTILASRLNDRNYVSLSELANHSRSRKKRWTFMYNTTAMQTEFGSMQPSQ